MHSTGRCSLAVPSAQWTPRSSHVCVAAPFPVAGQWQRARRPPAHCPRAAADHTAPSSGEPDPSSSAAASPQPALEGLDLNQLQTALYAAIASEKYELAAEIRDVLGMLLGPDTAAAGDWRRLGIAEWLADRAEDLGFRLPTEVQRRAAPVILDGDDCILESETGSGKTLAFLLPALSRLGYPPVVYPDDLLGPQLLVVVPTRELGVQAVMLTYKLLGGSVNPGLTPGGPANMFRYHGPRGIRVKGLLLGDEVDMAVQGRYLLGAHVVVGTPDLIQEAMERGVEVAQHCRVVVVDEVDACCAQHPRQMAEVMHAALTGGGGNHLRSGAPRAAGPGPERAKPPHQRPAVVLVGATIGEALIERAAAAGWVLDPVHVAVGARMQVPRGLRHRYILCQEGGRVGDMCRQLRADLGAHGPDAAPPRVMVFAGGEAEARALAPPLRAVLWGQHRLSVLLPDGAEPLAALHAFRDNRTTLLLASPAAARGLDLPAVTHVYNVQPPADAADYLHRAGRAGRIGAAAPGTVTTMATPEELPRLAAIAEALGLALERVEAPAPGGGVSAEGGVDVEAARRALEDALALSPGGGGEGGGEGDTDTGWPA